MERIRCAPAMRGGIGQSIDDLQLLDDRARPAMIDHQRQRVVMLRLDVDEVSGPSISVMKCGSAFSVASHVRQS